jgi:hypothetical protein
MTDYEPDEFMPLGEDFIRFFLLAISHAASGADIYGVDFENSTFRMNRFCWCDDDTCKHCGHDRLSNFEHKESGLKIWWYKYIGRSMRIEAESRLTIRQLVSLLQTCLESIPDNDV